MNVDHMREALRLAVENVQERRGGPFGAVVVRGGAVLARGTNRVTTAHDPTAHAEVEAIRAACRATGSFQLDGCVLYASCEPCPMCLGAIYWARLDCVYYAATQADAAAAGFDDAFIYREIEQPPSERKIPMRRVKGVPMGEPFEAWARLPDREDY